MANCPKCNRKVPFPPIWWDWDLRRWWRVVSRECKLPWYVFLVLGADWEAIACPCGAELTPRRKDVIRWFFAPLLGSLVSLLVTNLLTSSFFGFSLRDLFGSGSYNWQAELSLLIYCITVSVLSLPVMIIGWRLTTLELRDQPRTGIVHEARH